jgi:6-phosphofructokinase 1
MAGRKSIVYAGVRIGILTGGGDAPGLNAVIRAVVKSAATSGIETIGIEDGFAGLLDATHWRPLTPKDTPGILRRGGTILGTTNQRNPLACPDASGTPRDCSAQCIDTFHRLGLNALVVIGGDGTLAIAYEFHRRGLPLVCVPKTIDNDIAGTASSFGFDTAVSFATEAIDRLHTTAEAHHRVMVVEVMGRYAGWIALHAGVAGGADVILIPEIPFDLTRVGEHVLARDRLGARFSIVVAAEGAQAVGGRRVVLEPGSALRQERLGGIGFRVASDLERAIDRETRCVLLGHLQRGGAPTSADRLLATRFGVRAVDQIRAGEWGTMIALTPPALTAIPLADVVNRQRTVPPDCDLVLAAHAVGIGFGD